MRVVDLRNVFRNCNERLIDVCGDLIYYAEEKSGEGHQNLFLLEYNQAAKRERILASFFLDKPSFVQHFFSFPEEIMIVLEDGANDLRVLRVDKRTGEELGSALFSLMGSFSDCLALDEYRLLVYTSEDEAHRGMFREYRRLTGLGRVAALYDLDDESCSYLRDPRLCAASTGNIVPYDACGERRVLLLEPHGGDADKRRCYEAENWLGGDVNDNVWLIPLFEFIVSSKAGEPQIPFELILSAATDGLARYAGIDGQNLYFRLLYFPLNDQRLCAVHQETGERRIVAELNVEEGAPDARFYIERNPMRAYRVTTEGETNTLDGLWNSGVHASFRCDSGDFIACVEDRFIVTRYVLADDRDSFTFHTIYDAKTGKFQCFECACAIHHGSIILY